MIFEIKPYQSNSVLFTATSIDEIPVEDLESMYFDGMQLYMDGEKVTPEQVKIRIKIIKEDEEWEAAGVLQDNEKNKEAKPMDSLDLENLIKANEQLIEEDNESNSELNTLEDDTKLDEDNEEIENSSIDTVSKIIDDEDNKENDLVNEEKPGIYVDDENGESQYFTSMASASRSLEIPSYKISDAIKQNKEINGLRFRKVE